MKRKLFNITSLVLAGLMATSCFDKGKDEPQEVTATIGVYILNEGTGQEEDILLSYYDTLNDESTGTKDIFKTKNGMSLGLYPHDMVIMDDYLVISVTGSKEIKVVDKTSCQLLKTIKAEADGKTLSPKCLVAYEGSIYATFAEGYVGRVSVEGGKISTLERAGKNPEGIAVCNSQIYVANSGDATVSVFTNDELVKKKDIKVAENPQKMISTGDNRVFVISGGNGREIPAVLQMIDVAGTVSVVEYTEHPYDLSLRSADYMLYVVDRYTDETGNDVSCVMKFKARNDMEYAGIIAESGLLGNVATVSVDNLTGTIYVCTSNGRTPGELVIYSEREVLFKKVPVGGLNTRKVAFVKGQIWI